jgi:hypothetical protein
MMARFLTLLRPSRGVKAEGRRASLGRTHGPAIWQPWARSLNFVRTLPP